MTENTDKEHLENLPEENIPHDDTDSATSNQVIENMEVHHHAHHDHGEKNWKSYFREFFMLFLAVFCGFLAEYQLEHKIENDRAKELAKSFYAELFEDSVRLDKVMELRSLKETSLKYLMNYFEKGDFTKEADSAFRCISFAYVTVTNRIIFEPSDGILIQLQNSGSRRYFKSQVLQDAISKLASSVNFIRLRNERELNYATNTLRPFYLKHFDYKWLFKFLKDGNNNIADAFLNNNKVDGIVPLFKKPGLIDRDDAINMAGNMLLMVRIMKTNTFPEYRLASNQVMKQLRQEFDLH